MIILNIFPFHLKDFEAFESLDAPCSLAPIKIGFSVDISFEFVPISLFLIEAHLLSSLITVDLIPEVVFFSHCYSLKQNWLNCFEHAENFINLFHQIFV